MLGGPPQEPQPASALRASDYGPSGLLITPLPIFTHLPTPLNADETDVGLII